MTTWVPSAVAEPGSSRHLPDASPSSERVQPPAPAEDGWIRSRTVPYGGTVARKAAVVVPTTLDHRSVTVYVEAAVTPTALADDDMVCAVSDSLNSATSRSPPASGFTMTCRAPSR